MTDAVVWVEGSGAVRTLRLDRPDRHNAQTPQLWAELASAGRQLSADPEVRCVVLTGAGPSFSSGIDLDEMRRADGFLRRLVASPAGDPDPMLTEIAVAQDSVRWIPRAPFLVVAAVTGVAIGAGCQLALACDVRIVADDARFGLKEVRFGLLPDLGGGLALRAVPAGGVLAAAQEYAAEVARAPRVAIAHIKAAVDVVDRNLSAAAVGQAACIRAAAGSLPS